jgi:hypothetical protein
MKRHSWVAEYHPLSHEHKSKFWESLEDDPQKGVFCLILIPTGEWTSDEVLAVYKACCTLPKEEKQLTLELAVASLMGSRWSAPAVAGSEKNWNALAFISTSTDVAPKVTHSQHAE